MPATHINESASRATPAPRDWAPLSATRLLIFGGIALILAGMLFGEVFAIFILHPNADRVGGNLLAAVQTAAAGGPAAEIEARIAQVNHLLENRGTKVDTHVHVIVFGYLALILALVQPYVALSAAARRRLAVVFLIGATVLPIAVLAIHYVGLAYSPFSAIGWASVAADSAGFLVIAASAGYLYGFWRFSRGSGVDLSADESPLLAVGRASRILLCGGTLLILAGFLHGAWYAAVDLYRHEAQDTALLRDMARHAAAANREAATQAVMSYGALQGNRAVKIAAHAHIIEFGLLAILLAFAQGFIFLRDAWKVRWAWLLLAGSVILPLFVLAELQWGLVAGGIADAGGFLVIFALAAMLVGVARHTGALDAGGVAP